MQLAEEEERTFIIRDDTVSGSKNISFPSIDKTPQKFMNGMRYNE